MKIDVVISNSLGENDSTANKILELGMIMSDNVVVAMSNRWAKEDVKLGIRKSVRDAVVEYGLREYQEFNSNSREIDSCIISLQRECKSTKYSKSVSDRVIDSWEARVEAGELVLDSEEFKLLSKVKSKKNMSSSVIFDVFGVSNDIRHRGSAIKIVNKINGKRSISGIGLDEISSGKEHILKWKVVCDAALINERRLSDLWSDELEIIEPGTVVSNAYCLIESCSSKVEAERVIKYMRTRIIKRIIDIVGNIPDARGIDAFRYIPKQRFECNAIDWSRSIEEIDSSLMSEYGITESELNKRR